MVAVCLRTNRIFELNRTGARIWDLLGAGRGADEIATTLQAEFEVSAETAAAEVAGLINRLTDAGLIEVADAG